MAFGHALYTATAQAMEADARIFAYGQGINDPGGYWGSTAGMAERFTEARCFDVPLSEEALIGMGVGAALLGQHPLYVALRIDFLLLAMNQIINHAAKWVDASGHRCAVPLTIRCIIGKEWGQSAQHSGAYHAMFSQVPGLQVVMPSNPSDAAGLLLTSLQSRVPTIFVEAKPLYEMSGEVALPVRPLLLGQAHVTRWGNDITFIAVSYMVEFAESVADRLEEHGVSAEVLDLRTLAPLDETAIIESVRRTGRVAVFDPGWQRFGLAAEVSRIITMNIPGSLSTPLISAGQKWEHTPGGCFREHSHYPLEGDVVRAVLRQGETIWA